jgi:hypothetical protein
MQVSATRVVDVKLPPFPSAVTLDRWSLVCIARVASSRIFDAAKLGAS